MFLLQMAAFNIQEALVWKERIENVIDQVIVFGLLLISDDVLPPLYPLYLVI
jgi:hypothetical protein